jgi:SAM-dependent methyltransferase
MSAAPELPFSAAAERNRAPILQVLQRVLPARARVLEIASGTGQHAQHFASASPGWAWQPTDADASMRAVIDARCAGLPGVAPALQLDVLAATWPLEIASLDALYCANMLHISPWATCAALMAGAARHLVPGGLLVIYGPFLVDGVPTSPGNTAFDADLRARDSRWGLRTLAAVQREALAQGLVLQEHVPMPAHNLTLVFRRS